MEVQQYTEQEIAEFDAMIRSRGASFSERIDHIIGHYKNINADVKKRTQIRYNPEWIEKILSGQKTMTITRTQYPCGVYDVVNDATGRIAGKIEVIKVEKFDVDLCINAIEKHYGMPESQCLLCYYDLCIYQSGFAPDLYKAGLHKYSNEFVQYHRENYAALKYAHTFELVKEATQ